MLLHCKEAEWEGQEVGRWRGEREKEREREGQEGVRERNRE